MKGYKGHLYLKQKLKVIFNAKMIGLVKGECLHGLPKDISLDSEEML